MCVIFESSVVQKIFSKEHIGEEIHFDNIISFLMCSNLLGFRDSFIALDITDFIVIGLFNLAISFQSRPDSVPTYDDRSTKSDLRRVVCHRASDLRQENGDHIEIVSDLLYFGYLAPITWDQALEAATAVLSM